MRRSQTLSIAEQRTTSTFSSILTSLGKRAQANRRSRFAPTTSAESLDVKEHELVFQMANSKNSFSNRRLHVQSSLNNLALTEEASTPTLTSRRSNWLTIFATFLLVATSCRAGSRGYDTVQAKVRGGSHHATAKHAGTR